MGLPAEGRKINVLYRNREDDVAKFLNARHGGHYMIFNLSEKRYAYGKFYGAVQEYGWPDHHAPPLAVLLDAVQAMDAWLARSPANIVAVHCKAGRGRTGTVVVCLLHYLGLCASIPQALHWFADRRSRTGEGVSLPSQVRYCHYFAHTMAHGLPARRPVTLVGLEFQPVPGMGVEGRFCPGVELSKAHAPKKPFFSTVGSDTRYAEGDYTAMVRCHQPLQGDICVRVSHQSVVPGAPLLLLMRAQFHTAFVPLPALVLRYPELDGPASAPLSDSRFVAHFTLTLHFEEPSPFAALPSPSPPSSPSPSPSSASALSEMKTPYLHNGRATPPLPSSSSSSSPLPSPSPSPSPSHYSSFSSLAPLQTCHVASPHVASSATAASSTATAPHAAPHATFPSPSPSAASAPLVAAPSPPVPSRAARDSPPTPALHAPSRTAVLNHVLTSTPALPLASPSPSSLAPLRTTPGPSPSPAQHGALGGEQNARRHLEKRHYQQNEERLLDSPPPIDRSLKGRSLPPGASSSSSSSSLRSSPLVATPPPPHTAHAPTHGPPHRTASDLTGRPHASHSSGRASHSSVSPRGASSALSPSPAYLSSPAPSPTSLLPPERSSPAPRAASVQLSSHAPPRPSPATSTARTGGPGSQEGPDDFTARMASLLGPGS